ncbi:MAG: HPF/RaiA family ribosome-associated protein [Solirubrobacteraceae bacterium]
MIINIQALNFKANSPLTEYVQKKMDKINLLYDKVSSISVYFKLLNNNTKQNKFSEFILHIPGEDLVVKKQGQSFEECVDLSLDAIKIQLEKEKNKKRK